MNELPAMVSPWHANGDINSYVKQMRADPRIEEIKIRLLVEALSGLQYLHDNRIVHADIKGANVLVTDDGTACVCDFGISIMLEEHTTSAQRTTMKGTCRWMAPELFADDAARHTVLSDVWAFGCLILEVRPG
ncbi:kinase-like protein, partial [Exidia glandulosa HHB12029]